MTWLDRGKELFDILSRTHRRVEIYVPGSRHVFRGKADAISLSQAGKAYLGAAGVALDVIRGDDLNERYKGAEGVYGSADECFVAASYFMGNDFGLLASVVSPAQLFRKALHYIEFEVLPLSYSVPTMNSYHNILDELFEEVPHVLYADGTLQGDHSDKARRLREERKP